MKGNISTPSEAGIRIRGPSTSLKQSSSPLHELPVQYTQERAAREHFRVHIVHATSIVVPSNNTMRTDFCSLSERDHTQSLPMHATSISDAAFVAGAARFRICSPPSLYPAEYAYGLAPDVCAKLAKRTVTEQDI